MPEYGCSETFQLSETATSWPALGWTRTAGSFPAPRTTPKNPHSATRCCTSLAKVNEESRAIIALFDSARTSRLTPARTEIQAFFSLRDASQSEEGRRASPDAMNCVAAIFAN